MPKKMAESTFHVRYAETDQMGIVHHASYVVWLEEGRSTWLRTYGRSYAEFEAEGFRLAVSELQVRYKQPARYDQQVTVRCWIAEVRSRQVQFNYQIVDTQTGAIFVNGYTKHICLDQTGAVAKIPTQWQQLMESQ